MSTKTKAERYAAAMDEEQLRRMKRNYNFPAEAELTPVQIMGIKREESISEFFPQCDRALGRMVNVESLDVGNGSWVLITKEAPVAPEFKPVRWGMYWGVPLSSTGRDPHSRTGCKVLHNTESVTLFQDEYIIPSKETFDLLREEGWYVREIGSGSDAKPDMEYIEKSRTLCEDEREIIMALQLDGLTEEQACSEYFSGRYLDTSNVSICYLPPEGASEWLTGIFGSVGDPAFLTAR